MAKVAKDGLFQQAERTEETQPGPLIIADGLGEWKSPAATDLALVDSYTVRSFRAVGDSPERGCYVRLESSRGVPRRANLVTIRFAYNYRRKLKIDGVICRLLSYLGKNFLAFRGVRYRLRRIASGHPNEDEEVTARCFT